jgi:hypothetical protein
VTKEPTERHEQSFNMGEGATGVPECHVTQENGLTARSTHSYEVKRSVLTFIWIFGLEDHGHGFLSHPHNVRATKERTGLGSEVSHTRKAFQNTTSRQIFRSSKFVSSQKYVEDLTRLNYLT